MDNKIQSVIDKLGEITTLTYVYNDENQFIPGKTPVYYSGPYWDNREIIAAVEALLNGKWLSSGENVHKFEIQFAKKINQKHAVMVNSGSSANLVMIAALKKFFNWQDGDEILVSVVGFPTTLAPIIQNNLKPVFIDIEMETLNFDLYEIQKKINKKTRAIFVSPVLGNPPDFDELIKLCEQNNLRLVLDNCDSLGTKWDNKYLNEYAIASSYSFYPAHHISTAEGGMVTSNIEEIISTARSFAWWGRACYCVGAANMLRNGTCGHRFDNWLPEYRGILDHKYIFTNIGYNLKPLDLQGAIGLIQLEKFDEIHKRRKHSREQIANIFMEYNIDKETKENRDVRVALQSQLPKSDVSWFGTGIICQSKNLKNELVQHLENNKIQTRNYFAGNLLIQPAFKYLDNWASYRNANQVLDRIFFVGSAPHYTQPVFDYIAQVLSEFKYDGRS